ncbi:MAG TPA: SDR family oxidoreductase [Pseudomonadales bacterium]|nr:SDR family oxidoreductase [Pseudomonadales bacterium]
MDLGLAGRTALVAGASAGIGLGIAEALLAEGAKVMLTGRSPEPLTAAAEALADAHPGRVAEFAADMTLTDGIRAALDATAAAFGPPDILVANVGGGYLKPGWDIDDADLDAALQHNLTGTLRLVREGIRRMRGRDRGSIVVISSIAGVDAMGGPFAYGVAKAGLNHFVATMAREIGPGLRINVVAPGNILFEGGAWARNVAARPDAWNRWIEREVALKRFGSVEEIADVVAFLASERAAFVTGATWIADGGQVRSTS